MDTALDIRRVDPNDLDLLAKVDARLTDDLDYRRRIGELLGSRLSWAAMDGGEPLGFAIVTRHFFAYPFVDLLVVSERARRRGVGTALMARCEAAHDSDRIFTSTNESNAPMRRLLSKAGWQASGVIDNLDPGDPERVYVKRRG